jgi:uncharacterized membrane protein YeiH
VPPEHSLTLVVIDLIGIFVFAVTGALVAVRKELDVFGVLVVALTAGLGGGFIRDVLIGAVPPAALQDWRYLLVPIGAGLLTFWFHPSLGRLEKTMNVFDAAGLALFAVAGALKAMDFGLGPLPSTLMGLVTGIGGGMVRDVLTGRVPTVMQRGELYAIPAAAGAAVAAFGREAGFGTLAVATVGAALCFGWRLLAVWRHWHAPMPQGPASV